MINRKTDPPRALDLIFSYRDCIVSIPELWRNTWTHGGSVHTKHHSTASNYSTEPHKPHFSSFTQQTDPDMSHDSSGLFKRGGNASTLGRYPIFPLFDSSINIETQHVSFPDKNSAFLCLY